MDPTPWFNISFYHVLQIRNLPFFFFTPTYYVVQNYYLDKSIPFEVRFSLILEQHMPMYA